MVANLILNNARVYNVEKFDVILGQNFKIDLVDLQEGESIRWFSDNDPILSLSVSEDSHSAEIVASSVGKSEIQLQSSGAVVKTFYIEIYDTQASSLNPTVAKPVLK